MKRATWVVVVGRRVGRVGSACTAGEQVIVNGQLVAPFCFGNGVKFQSKTETSDPFVSFIDYYKSGGPSAGTPTRSARAGVTIRWSTRI